MVVGPVLSVLVLVFLYQGEATYISRIRISHDEGEASRYGAS